MIIIRRLPACLFLLSFMVLPGSGAKGAPGDGDAAGAKVEITYRKIKENKAYSDASTGQHIDVKITPPKTMGKDSYVLVEMFNRTQHYISVVDFDMTLYNDEGFDLTAHVNCTDMRAGRSALRKVRANGSGLFPLIDKVKLEHLQMLNDKAVKVVAHTFVDLVVP